MANMLERDQKFLNYWAKRRPFKRFFLLKSASFWGLAVAVPGYLFQIDFEFSEIIYTELLFRIALHFLLGVLFAHWYYKANKKRYLDLITPAEKIGSK